MTFKHQNTIICDHSFKITLLILVLVQILLTALIVSRDHHPVRVALPHPCERGKPVAPVRQDKCRPFNITFLS